MDLCAGPPPPSPSPSPSLSPSLPTLALVLVLALVLTLALALALALTLTLAQVDKYGGDTAALTQSAVVAQTMTDECDMGSKAEAKKK